MKRTYLLSSSFSAVCAVSVHAQAIPTWVSGGLEDDINSYTRVAPYKTFAGVFSRTAAGGEIDVGDTGGFGALTITKAITIDGNSSSTGVLATGIDGILLAAAQTDVVTLHSPDLNGGGQGLEGIEIQSAGAVRIEESRIYDVIEGGINTSPAAAAVLPMVLTFSDSLVRDCKGENNPVVTVNGAVTATFDKVQIHGCPVDLNATDGSKITVSELDFLSNAEGVAVAGNAIVNLDSGLISDNTTVVHAGLNSTIRLTNNSILDHGVALSTAGGKLVSFNNNNRIKENGTDGNPTTTFFLR